MGHIVVKQPDGKLAVWSTIVDDFVLLDCDEADLFAHEVVTAARWAASMRSVRRGGMNWEEYLEIRRRIHGNEPGFCDNPLDDATSDTPSGNWEEFFELKLAELCAAYHTRLMDIRSGKVADPPKNVGDLRAHYEELLARLVTKDPQPTCSKCGLVFDIGCEQICPGCGNQECAAYKPWIRGCNSQEPCPHRPNCEWAKG